MSDRILMDAVMGFYISLAIAVVVWMLIPLIRELITNTVAVLIAVGSLAGVVATFWLVGHFARPFMTR